MTILRPMLMMTLVVAAVGSGGARADIKVACPKPEFKADCSLLEQVSNALLAVMERPPEQFQWPPDVRLLDSEELNAWAHAKKVPGSKKHKAFVTFTPEWMREIVRGDADVLAITLGHELGHIVLGHVLQQPRDTSFTEYTYKRLDETEADLFGAKLMLKAGYSLRKAIAVEAYVLVFNRRHFSEVDALGSDHPSWVRRYRDMAEDPEVWRAMNSFTSGVTFLSTEHYSLAADCFDRVVKEFPGCYEAWVNRGYAYLMLYCDKLTTEDLQDYGVGQVVCGGFYRRAKSLEPLVRGRDPRLWREAVGSFQQALRLKADLALARANLALAYLFHPDGADADTAVEMLAEANDALAADETLEPIARASVLVNLGVAEMAGGSERAATKQFDAAVALVSSERDAGLGTAAIESAVLFNAALAKAGDRGGDNRAQAATLFERYLSTTDPNSAWWPVAFEQYVDLAEAAGRKPREKQMLRGGATRIRPAISLDLGDGQMITLAEPTEEVLERLGPAQEVRVLGPGLRRYKLLKFGVDFLATDQVVAVILSGDDAPAIPLRAAGPGGDVVFRLKTGLDYKDVKKALVGQESFARDLLAQGENYRYYRRLGVAIRYKRYPYGHEKFPYGEIEELVLVRIPD